MYKKVLIAGLLVFPFTANAAPISDVEFSLNGEVQSPLPSYLIYSDDALVFDASGSYETSPPHTLSFEWKLDGSVWNTSDLISVSGTDFGPGSHTVSLKLNSSSGQQVNGPSYSLLVNTTDRPSEVPIPAAAWLFGSGLIGLVGVAKRRKS